MTTGSSSKTFDGQLAVITGGGDGMGRTLAVALAAEGCDVAICDVAAEGMETTLAACRDAAPSVVVSSHICDVSDEAALEAFRDAVLAEHGTDHIDLLFNNAGIGGAGSMVLDERAGWERTFDICWGGVYLGTRVFLPLLMKSESAHIINTSSVNGFWASMGPHHPHTAYSAAKFAVKGFTEALVQDLRLNAPNVAAHVVMPGHIGTGIAVNSAMVRGIDDAELPEAVERGAAFRNNAPTTAESAATIILDGVRNGQWRILVGEDAHILDMSVRAEPDQAYELDFVQRMKEQGVLDQIMAVVES